MHNRIQTAVMFKNLLASMLSYTYKYNGFFTILNHILQCLKSSQTHFEVETHISIETKYKHNETKQTLEKKLTLLKKYKAKLCCQCTMNRQCYPSVLYITEG